MNIDNIIVRKNILKHWNNFGRIVKKSNELASIYALISDAVDDSINYDSLTISHANYDY